MDSIAQLFWKARAKLQPEYTRIIEPLRVRRVGDLADPLYFDFVSGVQVRCLAVVRPPRPSPSHLLTRSSLQMKEAERAIAKAIDEGFVAYEERVCPPSPDGDPSCPLEAMESKRVVSHPGPELWAAFEGRLGERILTGLAREGNDLGEATVAGQGASREQIEERVRALCGVLRSQGYALKVDVRSESPGPGEGNRLVVTWFAGCSLWGAQYCGVGPKSTKGLPAFLSVAALAGGKAKGGGVGGLSLGTAFDAYAIRALLLRMGAKNVAVAAYADGDASEMVTQVTWGAQA